MTSQRSTGDSHAIAVTVDSDVPLTRLFGDLPVRLWEEEVPAYRSDDRARSWRRKELRRPLASGQIFRGLLANYLDGRELILTADRTLLDTSSLRALAAAWSNGRPAELHGNMASPEPADELAEFRPLALDWCVRRGPAPEFGEADLDLDLGRVPDGDVDAAVLAALAVTLSRYEDRGEVAVGTTRSGTVCLLPLTVGDEQKVDALVAEAGSALTRGGSPVGQLAGPDGRIATVALDLDTAYQPGESWSEPRQLGAFPLTLHVSREQPDRLTARIRYDSELFDPAMVRQFTQHLANVLDRLGATPSMPVGELRLLTSREEGEIVRLGDGGALPPARWTTIPDAIADRTADQPDAPAVSFEGTDLTYRELGELSERVRTGLRAQGVKRGAKVGVCLPRSAELVAILLGVLRAGASYVPMDPDYPAERLRYTADDADLSAVIAAPAFPAAQELVVLRPEELLATPAAPDADVGARPDDPAYLIYTSGSTGRPKGVVVPHRTVLSLLEATRDTFEFGPADTWTQFHSVAFDFSVWEIWGCLMTGGRLVVVPPLVARSPGEFFELLRRERVTVLNQTPTAFGQLAAADGRPAELALRLVIFGGETLEPQVLTGWLDSLPESACRLVNMFGITETTVHVTAEDLGRHSALEASRTVGKPLPGWFVVVRDPAGRVVPVGVKGEIWVGGAGVTLGYHHRDELTAQRFVTDPVSGVRAYRSGDLGRLLPDGRLEHLGRIDDQVSIRGHRVEIGEITSVLLQDPAVTAAAVTVEAAGQHGDGTRLHAFVVAPDGTDPLAVRRRASRILPQYMLPATIRCVSRLPLTANGKLDVEALPPPTPATGVADEQSDAVQTICQVWGQLVGVPVEPSDDFFELGGNSLLATKLSLALTAKGFPGLPVRQLYRRPTPLGVAAYYDELALAQPADADPRGATVPC